jgi:hypothetical protein
MDSILPNSSFEKDILQWLSFGTITDADKNCIKYEYYRKITKGLITKNPVHDMLFYAMYTTFSEAMFQTNATHMRLLQTDPTDSESPARIAEAPTPSSTEYFSTFEKLVRTYARLFPDRLQGMPSAGAPTEGDNTL